MESSLHQTVEWRSELGKSLRKRAPRTSHAQWPPESARPDPIGLLEDQNERDYEAFLEEIRSGRMEAAPEPS